MVMMGIRIACLVAMVFVMPYSWYTWIFAAGAVFLPYIAVVFANVGEDTRGPAVQSPERMLEAPAAPRPETAAPAARQAAPTADRIIRISESPPRKPDA